MRRFILVLASLALTLTALPSTAAARTLAFRGTVVARRARPLGYLVAPRRGHVRLVRTRAHLRVGRAVTVRGRLLPDRSVRATRVRRAAGASAPLPVSRRRSRSTSPVRSSAPAAASSCCRSTASCS